MQPSFSHTSILDFDRLLKLRLVVARYGEYKMLDLSGDFHMGRSSRSILISNLVGVGLQNGFDATNALNVITSWTRLGRSDRDDVQREFYPFSDRHALRHRFKMP
jgi:hypothetical protein